MAAGPPASRFSAHYSWPRRPKRVSRSRFLISQEKGGCAEGGGGGVSGTRSCFGVETAKAGEIGGAQGAFRNRASRFPPESHAPHGGPRSSVPHPPGGWGGGGGLTFPSGSRGEPRAPRQRPRPPPAVLVPHWPQLAHVAARPPRPAERALSARTVQSLGSEAAGGGGPSEGREAPLSATLKPKLPIVPQMKLLVRN